MASEQPTVAYSKLSAGEVPETVWSAKATSSDMARQKHFIFKLPPKSWGQREKHVQIGVRGPDCAAFPVARTLASINGIGAGSLESLGNQGSFGNVVNPASLHNFMVLDGFTQYAQLAGHFRAKIDGLSRLWRPPCTA